MRRVSSILWRRTARTMRRVSSFLREERQERCAESPPLPYESGKNDAQSGLPSSWKRGKNDAQSGLPFSSKTPLNRQATMRRVVSVLREEQQQLCAEWPPFFGRIGRERCPRGVPEVSRMLNISVTLNHFSSLSDSFDESGIPALPALSLKFRA